MGSGAGVVVQVVLEGQDGLHGKRICYFAPSPAKDTLNVIPARGLWGLNMSFVIKAPKS